MTIYLCSDYLIGPISSICSFPSLSCTVLVLALHKFKAKMQHNCYFLMPNSKTKILLEAGKIHMESRIAFKSYCETLLKYNSACCNNIRTCDN